MRILPFLAALAFGTGVGQLRAQTTPAAPEAQPAQAASKQAGALEALVSKPILMLPAQYLSFSDSLRWNAHSPRGAIALAVFDSAVAATLRERGVNVWRYAADITRAAKRNLGFVADPHAIAATSLRFGRKPPKDRLGDPLASQLRSLIALNDARFVLMPVELRSADRDKQSVLVARLAIVDARASQVQWIGEVTGTPATQWSDAVLTDLATKVADLIAPAS